MAENKVPAHTVPHLACEYPNVSRFLCLHTEWASQVPDSSLPTAVPRKRATHRLVGQQRLLHYWQIMKCVYISNNQQDSLQGYLNEIRYILSETRTHSLSLSHTHHRMGSNKLLASVLPGSEDKAVKGHSLPRLLPRLSLGSSARRWPASTGSQGSACSPWAE